MKKLNQETKQKLIDMAKSNNINIITAIRMVGDFGKYKVRKNYKISDIEYLKQINDITTDICSKYHSLNIAVEYVKALGKMKGLENACTEINEMTLANIEKKNLSLKPKLEIVRDNENRTIN